MRCRRNVTELDGSQTIVWFGSHGIDDQGKAKFVDDKKSFAEKQEGVACSLTQRLNVLKGELWYAINEGLPLFDKNITIASMDAWIVQTIYKHPDVKVITKFSSELKDHRYSCKCTILSTYGEVELSI